MINRCLVSNLYLKLYNYIFQFLFLTDEYKSKCGGVWQECCEYGSSDMMQMKSFILRFSDWTLQPQNATKLDAQKTFGVILVVGHSNFAF